MKLTKAFAVILALVFCLSAFAACSGPVNYAENNTEFVIGVSGPLTGGAAIYGNAVANAAKIAADYTVKCIENTQGDADHWYGAKFETALGDLIQMLK